MRRGLRKLNKLFTYLNMQREDAPKLEKFVCFARQITRCCLSSCIPKILLLLMVKIIVCGRTGEVSPRRISFRLCTLSEYACKSAYSFRQHCPFAACYLRTGIFQGHIAIFCNSFLIKMVVEDMMWVCYEVIQ